MHTWQIKISKGE